jgi:hypothetical protein
MNFNDEVDWPELFKGYISDQRLADPRNKRRESYVATMIYLESAARELDDQLCGRSSAGRYDLGWARITRTIVIKRAGRIADELSECDRRKLRLGDSGFRHRWQDYGGMSDFFMCVVRYVCTAPQWCRIFDYGPRKSLEELSRVKQGELGLSDLISKVASHDLKVRVRLARCWLFPLSLTIDAKWKAIASKACREILEAYTDRWVPVFEEELKQFDVMLRPGESPKQLATSIGAAMTGYAGLLASCEGESCPYGETGFELFVRSVQREIFAAIDPGDGRTVPEALNLLVHQQNDGAP